MRDTLGNWRDYVKRAWQAAQAGAAPNAARLDNLLTPAVFAGVVRLLRAARRTRREDAGERFDPQANLRAAHGASGGFKAAADVGWNAMILRLLARLDSTASHADTTIPITQVKEKFGLSRVYLDLGDADPSLQTKCEAVIADAEAESACCCQRCGTVGEMAQDRRYLVVLCQHHRHSRADAASAPAPERSAHTRLRLAARFGAERWHEARSPFAAPMLRARLVEDGVAFAVSLRAVPRNAARAPVVVAALCHDDSSALHISGQTVRARETDLADRVAAEMQV